MELLRVINECVSSLIIAKKLRMQTAAVKVKINTWENNFSQSERETVNKYRKIYLIILTKRDSGKEKNNKNILCQGAGLRKWAMFVMVMSVRRIKTVFHTETVSNDKININHNNNNNTNNLNKNNNNNIDKNLLIKNINCINNHLQIIQTNNGNEKNRNCCAIDKNIKHILPISSVDSSTTILSPSALAATAAAQNSAQNSTNKFLLTELNNYRKTPTTTTTTTIQVSCCCFWYHSHCLNKHECLFGYAHSRIHLHILLVAHTFSLEFAFHIVAFIFDRRADWWCF